MQLLVLMTGVLACSTAVLMIKATTVDPVFMSAVRLLLAVMLLAPVYRRERRRYGTTSLPRGAAFWPGLVLAVHFIAWNIGARRTPAAHGSLIVSMLPLAMPPLAFALLRERPTAREWLGTGVAAAGMLLLTTSDFRLRPDYFYGDAMCFAAMLLFAVYLALGRKYRCVPSLWLYVVPVYATAGLLCLAASAALTRPFRAYTPWDLLMLAALAVIPTVVGHSALNAAMKHFPAQTVSVLNMGQFIFAGALAYACFGEVPAPVFYPASGLLIAGCWLVITGRKQAGSSPPPEPAAAAGGA